MSASLLKLDQLRAEIKRIASQDAVNETKIAKSPQKATFDDHAKVVFSRLDTAHQTPKVQTRIAHPVDRETRGVGSRLHRTELDEPAFQLANRNVSLALPPSPLKSREADLLIKMQKQMREMTSQMDELSRKLTAEINRCRSLQAQGTEKESLIASLTRKIDVLRSELETKDDQLREVQTVLANFSSRSTASGGVPVSSENQMQQLWSALSSLADTSKKMEESERREEGLRRDLTQARQVISEGEIDRGHLVIALRALEAKVKELEAAAAADVLATRREELDQAKGVYNKAGVALHNTVMRIDSDKNEMAEALRAKGREIDELQDAYRTETRAWDRERARFRAELERLERGMAEAMLRERESKSHILKLEREVDRLKRDADGALAAANTESFVDELKLVRSESRAITCELEEMRGENEGLREEIDLLKRRKSSREGTMDADDVRRLRAKVQQTRGEVKAFARLARMAADGGGSSFALSALLETTIVGLSDDSSQLGGTVSERMGGDLDAIVEEMRSLRGLITDKYADNMGSDCAVQ